MTDHLVCIGFPKWQGNYAKSTIMLMRGLSAYYHVLYVDYQHTLKDVLMALLGKRDIPVMRILGLKKRLVKDEERLGKIWVLTPPPVLPINWIKNTSVFRWFLRLNNFIVRRSITSAMRKLNIKSPIIVNAFNPFYGVFNRGRFNERRHVYYCYDEIGEAKWMNKHGASLELEYAAGVDAIVSSSSSLCAKMARINKSSYLVPNGVDFELFNRQAGNSNGSAIKTIGYTGSIDDRLDFDLIGFLANALPSVRFEFIGRILDRQLIRHLSLLSNVEFFDPVDYSELPEALTRFDLCLIPFKKNDFTRNIYPMKLNEYLAAGKLVLMTDFANLPEFERVAFICRNQTEALTYIKEIDLTEEEIQNRIKEGIMMAKEASWSNRARDFHMIIEK